MSFSSTHQKIVRLNDFDLRDLGGTASFEAQAISGRGLAPTRERELHFPGEMGSRDYGSYYSNRRIEISGILYADTMSDFRVGLDKLKEICRLRTFVDGVLYEQVEAQTLWLADESVIIGPYVSLGGIAGGGTWVSFIKDSDIPSRYASGGAESIVDTGNIGLKLELITSATAALVSTWDIIAIGPDHGSAPADSTSIYLSPASGPDSVGDQAVIRDDRYWLVNYSGSMNEERLTTQWYKTGYSRVTLPFKCVYPFAVSDPKLVDFVPNATNGYFKSIDTGNAISYPVYKIKGTADTPQVVETTHSLVWNANDNNATNILGDTVVATVSASGFYGQTGKLNQAIAFDSNLDKTQGDSAAVTNTAIRSALGIGSGLNYNQGTIGFWAKKAGDWYDDGTSPTIGQKYIINNYSGSTGISIYEAPSDSKIYFYVNDQSASYAYSLSAGNWFYFILRWDTRRTGFSSASSSAYLVLEVYDTSGNLLDSGTGTNTSDPAEAAAVNTSLYLSSDGTDEYFDGLIDDLAIWDRPLTDTERNTLVNSGTGIRADTVASSELVYYSDFDQTVGTTFDDEQIASSSYNRLSVSSISTVTIGLSGGGATALFSSGDRVILWDDSANKVQTTISSVDSDVQVTLAASAAAVAGSNPYIAKNLLADPDMELSGTTCWTASGATLAKETTIVKKDAQAIKITNTGAAQGYGRQTVTTASGNDFVVRGWAYGPATVNGASRIVDVDNTAALSLTATQAGLSAASWVQVESCFEAADASTTIDLGSGSTTSAEIGYFDDLKLLPNLANNGGMEGGANPPTGWTDGTNAAGTSDNTAEHSGTYAMKVTASAAEVKVYQAVTLVEDEWYEVAGWFKVTSGDQASLRIDKGGGSYTTLATTSSTSYVRLSGIFKATGTSGNVGLFADNNTDVIWADDVSVVHRPDLSVSFNNMTNGYRFEPTRLTRGYKSGANENYKFESLVSNVTEFSFRAVVRPRFPSTTANVSNWVFQAHVLEPYPYWQLKFVGTDDKFHFEAHDGGWKGATSPAMNFSQDEEIEIGGALEGGYLKLYINGSNAGGTNTACGEIGVATTALLLGGTTVNGFLIDDLEILAKSQPAEWFAEQHAKRNQAKNLNLPFKWSGTLDAGDILTVNALDPKVAGRVSIYDASAGTSSNQMSDADVSGSLMPILSPTKSMLYFPNSIPSGVEIYYRENHQ